MALRRMSEKFTRPKNKAAAPEEDSDSADFPNAIAKSEPAKPDARADSKTDLAAEKVLAEKLAQANSSDPSVAFMKQPAFIGFTRRRWFVLHRKSHTLAYYAKPFVPPEIGELKGFVDLVKVVDINAIGRKLELKVAKGRGTYKLIADTEKIARDWAKLVRAEAQLAGLDNPLNKMVQDACKPPEVLLGDDGEDLYMEYGGFKFAADEDPALYTDFDPTKANKGEGAGATADEEGYLEQQEGDPNAVDADDYVPDAAPADDGYLEQKPAGAAEASAPADDGYLEQKPATAGGGDAGARIESPGDVADDYVPPAGDDELQFGEAGSGGFAMPADDGYLEQKPAAASTAPADDGYLEQKATTDDVAGADADDYVPPSDDADPDSGSGSASGNAPVRPPRPARAAPPS